MCKLTADQNVLKNKYFTFSWYKRPLTYIISYLATYSILISLILLDNTILSLYIYIYICVSIYIYIYIYTHTHTPIHTHTHIYIYIYIYEPLRIFLQVFSQSACLHTSIPNKMPGTLLNISGLSVSRQYDVTKTVCSVFIIVTSHCAG